MIGISTLEPIAIFLLDATIKTTLFMGLVLLAVWLLGTRQAAKRSLLLSWCLIGVLVIPIASLCMPSLRFQFDSPSSLSEPAVPPIEPVVAPDTPMAKSTPALQRLPVKALSQDVELSQDFVSPSPAKIVFAKNAGTKSIDWTTYILNKMTSVYALYGVIAVYAIGVLILLIRLIYCLMQVRTFRQSLLPCEDEQLQNDLHVLKNQLRIWRPVALAVSDKISSPTQVGLLKPVVVLPTHIVKSREQLESILIHELIHVKRWDCLYRLLAMIGLAFYWFNPLFHRVKHLLFEVQEQACDDWTVTTIGNSESYADTLLNVATQLQPRPAMALGMDMARPTQIMARVNRIITLGGHVTPRVGRFSALVMAVVFIGGATAIGSLTTAKIEEKNKKIVFIDDASQVMDIDIPVKRFRVYSVSGVVSLNEGAVEGLEIRAFPTKRSNVPTYPKIDYTDANGVYRLDDLEPGEHRIIMSLLKEKKIDGRMKTIHYPVQSQTLIIEDRDVTLNFEPLSDVYSVSGVVSLNEGAIEGLKIMAFSAKRSSGRIFPKTDRTDANGAYRLDYLEPGEYLILVSAPEPEEVEKDGHTITIRHSGQSRTLVIEDSDMTLNFEPLALGDARITGIATYNGQPVSDVYVSTRILPDDPEIFVSLSGTETDEEGRFGLRYLPSARIAIRFYKRDHLDSGGKRWSKVDTVDLTNKKELSYMAELEMEERPTLSLGDMAPEFEANRLNGSTFRLSDYRNKKAVLIDFWATWCGPCVDEIPTIKSIAETYRDQGLEVVGVSLDHDEQALRDFVEKEKLCAGIWSRKSAGDNKILRCMGHSIGISDR